MRVVSASWRETTAPSRGEDDTGEKNFVGVIIALRVRCDLDGVLPVMTEAPAPTAPALSLCQESAGPSVRFGVSCFWEGTRAEAPSLAEKGYLVSHARGFCIMARDHGAVKG